MEHQLTSAGVGPSRDLRAWEQKTGALRLAVLFVNYGPYHVARARALARVPKLDTYFIELANEQKVYPWTADKRDLGTRLITLVDRPYEACRSGEVAAKTIKLLESLRPDVIAIAGYKEPAMRAAAHWARVNKSGVVVFSESTRWDHRRRWWLENMKRMWIRRYVDAAVVGGQPHRDYINDLGLGPARVWDRYNVVDNGFFLRSSDALRALGRSAREAAGLPENYFLYVGRFAPEKNLPFLLECYSRYREVYSGKWRLVMVGDGPQRAELLNIARATGLDDVLWPGFKQSAELPVYYAFAGCFVIPSALEPWGLVVNEAMACALPVLSSRRCGCSSDLVVPGANGFTFEPSDKEELARLMIEMERRSPAQRQAMGEFSRRQISRWTPEIWANQVEQAAICAAARKGRSGFATSSSDVQPEKI